MATLLADEHTSGRFPTFNTQAFGYGITLHIPDRLCVRRRQLGRLAGREEKGGDVLCGFRLHGQQRHPPIGITHVRVGDKGSQLRGGRPIRQTFQRMLSGLRLCRMELVGDSVTGETAEAQEVLAACQSIGCRSRLSRRACPGGL